MTFSDRCQACPECNPSGNPCNGCQVGGICDGFMVRCACNDEQEEPEYDDPEYESEIEP